MGTFSLLSIFLVAMPAWGEAPPRPSFTGKKVFCVATLSSSIAAGMVIAIDGSNLSNENAVAQTPPLPAALSGTQVLVDGAAIPILSVTPERIVAQLPWDIAEGERLFVVRSGRGASSSVPVRVRSVAPGIVTQDGLRAAFQNSDGKLNGEDAPAIGGSQGILYAVGLGPVDAWIPAGAANPAARAVHPVEVTIGGVPAEVVSASLVEGMLGAYRIQVKVPREGSGRLRVQVSVGGAVSNVAEMLVAADYLNRFTAQ